jgi:hypothetical protein
MIPISYVSLTKPLWKEEQGEFSKADDRRNAAEGLHKRSKAFAQSVQHICTKCATHLHKVCTTLAQVAPHGCTKSTRPPYRLYYIKFLFETSKT